MRSDRAAVLPNASLDVYSESEVTCALWNTVSFEIREIGVSQGRWAVVLCRQKECEACGDATRP